MSLLRSLFFTTPLIVLSTVVMGTLSLIDSFFDKSGNSQHAVARIWGRTLLAASLIRVRVEGADLRFARGDVRPLHAEMVAAAGGKNVWLVGGGDLVGQFHDHGLLDELIVSIAPVTLGRGAPLLPRRITAPPLRLREARAMGGAFVRIRYEVVQGA